ncbi:MAG: hypothetical protein K5644_03100 [Lachnospiraceae bacterium]|nr:hypothetical protein [Lachnospiraceae bacterium]
MAGLEIGLVVVGILIFVGSFFVTEKLSSSDMQNITRISEDEVKNIVAKQIAKSDEVIDERLHEKLDDAVNDFAIRTDDEYVAKMNQMNEYSEKVLETMEKTNNEIVFIHSMLNDKQETVTELTSKLDITKSQLLQLKSDVDERIKELEEQYEENIKLKKEQEFVTGIGAEQVESETVKSFEDELIDRINDEDSDAPDGFKEVLKASSIIESEEEHRLDEMLEGSDKENDSSESNITESNVSQNNLSDSNLSENNLRKSNRLNMSATESEIIKLYKEGYSEIEIAKRYGKGIGEIKLILGLYN